MKNTYQFSVGDFSCLAINDGNYIGRAAVLFANVPEGEWQQALQQHGLQPDHLPSSWTCLLIETADHLVLIDTGENNAGDLGVGRLRGSALVISR